MVFLCMLSFSSCALYAQTDIEQAIQKSDVEKLSALSGSGLSLTANNKENYMRINQRILNDINIGLKTQRFDSSDLTRLGLGTTSLATSLYFAYQFYSFGLDSLRTIGEENSDALQLVCAGFLPILAAPLTAIVGSREIYKGIKQFDRKQLRNRAQAVAALLRNVQTRDNKVERKVPIILDVPELDILENDEFGLFAAE